MERFMARNIAEAVANLTAVIQQKSVPKGVITFRTQQEGARWIQARLLTALS